jgi:hypothetical protein
MNNPEFKPFWQEPREEILKRERRSVLAEEFSEA